MKKFIKKIIIYLSITLLLGNLIGFTANYFLSKSQFYKSSFLVNAFNKGEKFDYFIVGSSRGLTTLNTNLIDQKLNLKGVNLSMDDTDLKTQFLMIKHFFNSGFSSKYLILTLDESHFKSTSLNLGNNDYRFSPFIRREYVKNHFDEYEKNTLGIISNANVNPFFNYSYYNFELFLPAALSVIKPNFRNKFDAKGNYSYPNSGVKLLFEKNNAIKQKITNPLVKEIKEFLKTKKCKLIIYVAPYFNKEYVFDTHKINYQIINHTNILNDDLKYFYDATHVNNEGRNLCSKLFSVNFISLIKK